MKNAFLFAILIFGIVRASETDEKPEETLKRGLTNKCVARETSSCIAIELVGYVDRMLRTASFQLGEDVMIVDESQGAAADIPMKSETLARAGTALEDQAQQLIIDKLWHFASSRSLRYRLLKDADLVISGKQEKDGSLGVGVALKPPKVFESGRARQKNIGPVLALAALKFGLFGALTFKVLALMVGKALLISKIALLLSTIIGLKKLFSSQSSDSRQSFGTE
ncbi:osiris 3 isoform X2 [Anticarsia gemmatalis]|uniref:osiris 3 isoform X2 n=1 Tax=Anticarsia gemmatalis TaxID=129554 RepID=UPI003F76CA73